MVVDSLPTWTNKQGKVFHKLEYNIEMTCDSGAVDFAIFHNGKRVGGQHIEVEFD